MERRAGNWVEKGDFPKAFHLGHVLNPGKVLETGGCLGYDVEGEFSKAYILGNVRASLAPFDQIPYAAGVLLPGTCSARCMQME